MKHFLLFFTVLSLFASSLFSQQKEVQTVDQVIDSIRMIMDQEHIPGLFVSMVRDDSVLYSGGLGYASLEDSIPVGDDHLFRMGSITKSFGALAMILLERKGKIDLDTLVREIAPEIDFNNPYKQTHPLRVRHLLQHTSGFDDMHPATMYNREDKEMSALDLVRNMEGSMLCRWEPGTRFAYSNPNYLIVGYLIEKVSGMPWEDYVDKHIFNPLGMALSNFKPFMDVEFNYAVGYRWEDGEFEKVGFRNIPAGMGGALNSNARDMTRLLQFFLGDGLAGDTWMFTPEEIDYMETPSTTLAARAGLNYGYGMGNSSSNYDNKILFHGHGGGIDGFISDYAYNREYDLGYALSNNGSRSLSSISSLIKAFLTRDIQEPDPRSEPVDPSRLDDYTGYYRFVSPRSQIATFMIRLMEGKHLVLEDDTLYQKAFMGDPQKLVHMGDLQFRLGDQHFPTRILLTREDGSKAFSALGSLYEKTGYWKIILLRVLIFGAAAIAVSLIPMALVWMVMAVLKKMQRQVFRRMLWPMLTLLFFIFMVVSLNAIMSDVFSYARISAPSLSYFGFSILFGLFSLITLRYAFRNKEKIRSWILRAYYYALGIGFSCLTVYLVYWKVIGFRFWTG